MIPGNTPIVKDLVLIGGGHSHLAVLKYFAMHPVPGLRLTLIARELHTPYSGMLPGYIAGHYAQDQAHIDLRPLALFAGSRIFHSEAQSLDLHNNLVICPNRPPIPFDLISIDTGSRPAVLHIPGADRFTTPVKPIDSFLPRWDEMRRQILSAKGTFRLVIVGGGAGGVELALATQYRLYQDLRRDNRATDFLQHILVTDSTSILPTHNAKVRAKFERVLRERNIKVYLNHSVQVAQADRLVCANGEHILADAVLLVTSASAPAWLAESGLQTDAQGFVAVNDCLQSVSHSRVFAAGDVAAVLNYPRPKAGVFAVRQGPPLARNLELAARGKKLKRFKPQRLFLSLISTGDQYAVASRSNWSVEGHWVWRLKDWIDRRFMAKYSDLPPMTAEPPPAVDADVAGEATLREIAAHDMRCGGCAAKVGGTVLGRAIRRLQPISREDVIVGLQAPDDAAVMQVPAGKLLVQSVDYFRNFIDDPYVFGKIAANHALSDIFAMGAEARWAMAIATVPFGPEKQLEELLFQMMSGAVEVLNAADAQLIGGHSSEGAELSFGLSVSGLVDRTRVLRKAGMQLGDLLVLTKPLGVGALFAADMRLQAKGRWIDAALRHMLLSNRDAGLCLQRHGATACTDITGFGLAGHLAEMSRASSMEVAINLTALPIMEGALDCIAKGITSSSQEQNSRLENAVKLSGEFSTHKHYPLLFDPQTAGGLLASLPADRIGDCLAELHHLGYGSAAVIGNVLNPVQHAPTINLTDD